MNKIFNLIQNYRIKNVKIIANSINSIYNKINVLNNEDINNNYDTFLYVDPDVIITKDISCLFSLKLKDNIIYTLRDGFVGSIWHSEHQPFDFSIINPNTSAFTDSMLLFKNSKHNYDLFNVIIRTVKIHKLKYALPRGKLQPFLVYRLMLNKCFDNFLLQKYCEVNKIINDEFILHKGVNF